MCSCFLQKVGKHANKGPALSVPLMDTGRLEVELGALQAFTNDERMRSFLALEAATGTAEVRARATNGA